MNAPSHRERREPKTGFTDVKYRSLLATVFVSVFMVWCGFLEASSQVKNIKVWKAPSHVRIVLDLDNTVTLSEVASENDSLFQIDIEGATIGPSDQEVLVESIIVEKFVLTQREKDVGRVSVWLKAGAEAKVYQLAPYLNRPPRVVIKIEGDEIPSPEEVFNLLEPEALRKRSEENLPVVIIDPGHGGEDPGALGPTKLKEKDVVMDVARLVKTYLEGRKIVKPVLTRSGDYYITLRDRISIAERQGASMFISLHTNASKNHRAAGTSVFHLSLEGATDEAAKLLAEKENAADMIAGEYDPSHKDVVFGIVVQMKQTAMINESSLLAAVMLQVLKKQIETVGRGIRQAGFAVLKSMMFPSVLVELAFITNKHEERKLRSKRFKKKLATALGVCIETYVNKRHISRGAREVLPVLPSLPQQKVKPKREVYTVKKGDTLWGIGRKYGVRIADILRMNNLKNSNMLTIGQKLFIPSF